MRKITLFLALMVAMVTTTMAQTVVTKLSDFSAEKCYTVTTTTRGGWAVMADTQGNYTQFCSTNDAGTMLTEEAQRFAVLTADNENYYLYSVAAKKFVKRDRSLNAKAGDAIEFTEAGEGRVRVNFKGIANSYINLGGSNQMSIDGWGTIDVGNSVQFLEVADFDATEALAALAAASFEQSLADVLGNTKVITECPEGVVAAKTAEGTAENCESTTIKRALQNVKLVEPTTVTVNFKYTTGNHKLIMLGVDLVNAEGTVVASDYHFGFTGGSHKDNTYTLDATAVAAGDYTLRYFFCHKANDHEVGNQQAKISVEGLKYVVTLPEGVVADPAELSATALYQIVPQEESRGALYALPESKYLTATKGKDVTAVDIDPADANQQFMFVENDGKMYLYAVGAGKFVNDEGQFLNLTAEPDHFVTVEKTGAAGFMFVKMNGEDMINVSGGYEHSGYAAWNSSDAGNNLRITLVGEADEATLAAIDAAFNPVVELVALEPTSFERNPLETAYNGQYKLQGVKLNFGDVIVKKYTTDLSGDYGYILDAEGNEVARLNKCMGGNGTANTFATPYAATAIQTPGTYKVVVLPDVILSADGTAAYKGGEFEFTVAERAVEITPSAEEGFCWNETYNKVADFSEFIITVNYAKNDVVINNDVKATMTTGETVYEAAVTVEKYGTTQEIKLAFAPAEGQEFAEGRYTINVPAGLFTVDGTANAEFAKSTFTYKKPALEIARDFDTWVDYIDELWSMPKTVMIKIANAESVEVDETKLATIAFGETVYTSAISWYYDDWSNAYYIEYTFEDFANTWDENGEFVEYEFAYGDYKFTLPAGAYTVNGEANEEAVKNYTYGAPIVEEFWINSINPASGKLEAIEAIAIEFSNGLKPDILYITNKETETRYTLVYNNGVYVPVDFNYEAIVIKDLGTYTLDLNELEGLIGNKVYTWTIAAPEVTVEIDATKEYHLYSSWNWGMNNGYLTIGNNSGTNYGNVYMAKEATQAFKFTLVEDGANKYYTLSNTVEEATGTSTKYINCSHEYKVSSSRNTPSGIILEKENETSTKYVIKTDNGYLKADRITYATGGFDYYVFSNGTREDALVFDLKAVEAEVPVVAPKITAIYPAENETLDCVSELVLTFDKEIAQVAQKRIFIYDSEGKTVCEVYGYNAEVEGNVVTFALTDAWGNALDIEEAGVYTIKINPDFFTAVDGGKFEGAEFKFTISEQIETAIENVDAAEEAVIYDITGRRIAEITKPGIYVVNGKKVLVK